MSTDSREKTVSVSRSCASSSHMSSSSSSSSSDVMSPQKIRTNILFPFLTEVLRVARLPPAFFAIFMIASAGQVCTSLMWRGSSRINRSDTNSFYAILYFVCDLGVTGKSISNCIPQYAAFFSVFILTMIILSLVFSRYATTRISSKWQLFVCFFICNYMYPIMSVISSSLFGRALYEMYLSRTNVSIAFSIVSFVSSIVCIIVYKYTITFQAFSPILNRELHGSFDPDAIVFPLEMASLSVVLAPFLDVMESWTTLFFIIVIAVFYSKIYHTLHFLPFIRFWFLPVYYAIMTMGHSSLVVAFISYFRVINTAYIAIFQIIVLISTYFISLFILSSRKNRIVKILTSSADTSTDTGKRAYFDSLNFSSVNDVICYLRVGLANHCDLFINTSFMRYLVENYHVKDVVISVARCLCFFPSEFQYLFYCICILDKYRNYSVGQEFLIYQMKNVDKMRQSSVSNEAVRDITKLQKSSRTVVGKVREFWSEISAAKFDISFESMRTLRLLSEEIQASFLDTAERYPNNLRLSEEFTNFLMEGFGDFSRATAWKRKCSMIEEGKHLTIDYNFLSLINVYPSYLKDKILTIRGEFVGKGEMYNSSSSTFMAESTTSTTNVAETKAEAVITTICNHGKLRLAIQNSLEKMRVKPLANSVVISILMLVISISLIGVLFLIIPSLMEESKMKLTEEYYASSAYIQCAWIGYVTGVQNGILRGFGTGLTYLKTLGEGILPSTLTSMNTSINNPYNVLSSTIYQGTWRFREFLKLIISDSSSTAQLNLLMNTTIGYQYFQTNKVWYTANINIKTSVMNSFDDTKILIYSQTRGYFNQVSANMINVTNTSSLLISSMATSGAQSIENILSNTNSIGLIPTIAFVVIFGFFDWINVRSIFKSMKQLSDTMRNVDPDVIEASLNPISLKTKSIHKDLVHPPHQTNLAKGFLPFAYALSIAIFSFVFIYTIFTVRSYIGSVKGVYDWLYYNFQRSCSLYRYINFITDGLAATVVKTTAIKMMNAEMSMFISSHESLISSVVSSSALLDEQLFTDVCASNESRTYAQFLTCISLDRQVSMAYTLMQVFSRKYINMTTGKPLNCVEYGYLIYLIDYSLANQFNSFQDSFYQFALDQLNGIVSNCEALWAAGIACLFIVFCFKLALIGKLNDGFKGAKQLIGVLPPTAVIKNAALMDIILGKKNENENVQMSVSEALIFRSSYAAISMNRDYVIGFSNPSLEKVTGFTPDKVLGQHISWLIPPPIGSSSTGDEASSSQFYQRLAQMKSGIGERVATLDVKCQTDFDSCLTMKATIVGLSESGNDSDEVETFVILLRSMDSEIDQKEKIKEAKRKADELLESLVPSQVLTAIRQQSNSQLFTTKLGTTIFIHMEGFTESAHTMIPKRTMQALNTVYDKFDIAASKYPAVHEIKYNDELYVACCGLFDFKENPESQASQAVHFCLDILGGIKGINEELGLALKLHIGVNMGGPLVGSVLNPSLPVFDILGDCMGLGIKMESYGKVGVVQIGESVVQYLPPSEFEIKEGQTFSSGSRPPEKSFIVSLKAAYPNIC